MKENMKLAWIASWFALVGQLVFFIGVALFTGDWRYVMWSFMVSMAAGVPSMIRTWLAQKKNKRSKSEFCSINTASALFRIKCDTQDQEGRNAEGIGELKQDFSLL